MKSIVKLDTYCYPWALEQAIANFVDCYNYQRYHESPDNLPPADVFFGRAEEILTRREEVKQRTLAERRQRYLQQALHNT
jgi:putative transposase